jgi:hypothetical protein
MKTGKSAGEFPWSPIHDIYMEVNGLDKFMARQETLDGEAGVERQGKGAPTNGIIDEAIELSHLVQSGRRVSKAELQAVDRKVHGPQGYLGS